MIFELHPIPQQESVAQQPQKFHRMDRVTQFSDFYRQIKRKF